MFEKEQYELKGKKFYTDIDLWSSKYHSLMSNVQKGFLMSLIEENKISNVLEIGVFNGVSSLCILKAGLSINANFNLYSIDISNNKDFIGKAVFDFCSNEEQQHYHLNLNTTSSNINNIISNNVKLDLVFIDGGHAHPEPLFDLLYCIPYMHNNTIIILHDIIDYMRPNVWGPSFIFESWTGDKYRLYDYDNNIFSNMGCIKLHSDKESLYKNILEISKTPFRASPRSMLVYNVYDKSIKKTSNNGLSFSIHEIKELSNYINNNYTNELSTKIENILIHNYNTYMNNYLLYMQETRFLNYIFETISYNTNRINKKENNK